MKNWEEFIRKQRRVYRKEAGKAERERKERIEQRSEWLLGKKVEITHKEFLELKKIVETEQNMTWPWKNMNVGEERVLTKEDIGSLTLREVSVKIYYYQQATGKDFERKIEDGELIIKRRR